MAWSRASFSRRCCAACSHISALDNVAYLYVEALAERVALSMVQGQEDSGAGLLRVAPRPVPQPPPPPPPPPSPPSPPADTEAQAQPQDGDRPAAADAAPLVEDIFFALWEDSGLGFLFDMLFGWWLGPIERFLARQFWEFKEMKLASIKEQTSFDPPPQPPLPQPDLNAALRRQYERQALLRLRQGATRGEEQCSVDAGNMLREGRGVAVPNPRCAASYFFDTAVDRSSPEVRLVAKSKLLAHRGVALTRVCWHWFA